MKYRRFGDSDLQVSEISLGSWLTYGGGVERAQAEACVEKAFEVGINFLDTANVYGRGKAETLLGEVLSGRERSSYILATKLYFPMSMTDRGLSREQVLKQVDLSLERLRTDYVDLYQCHRYDEQTPLEETMEALSEVVRAGKARYLGFSEWSAAQIQAAFDLPGVEKFVSSQPQYSMLWRKPERDIFPLCARNGISQIVWVAAGPGRPDREVPAWRPAAARRGRTGDERGDGRVHGSLHLQARVGGCRPASSRSRGGRPGASPVRAGLGSPGAERGVGYCGREQAGAGGGECLGVRDNARRRHASCRRRGAR